MSVCYWARSAPTGLAEAAENWGMTRMEKVFVLAHRDFKNHDDGTGRCKVCGAAIDFEGWLTEVSDSPEEQGPVCGPVSSPVSTGKGGRG